MQAREENQLRCVSCDEVFDDLAQLGQFQICVEETEDAPTLVSAACARCAARGKTFIMDKITTGLGNPGVHFSQEQ
jgi:hypothetical protein